MILTESTPVVVCFQIEDYTDALHFKDQADRDRYSAAEIEVMCQARYDNWKAVLAAPRPEPTPEEVQAQINDMVEQQRITQDQIIALAPPEVMLPILEGQAALVAEQLATLNEAAGRG